MEERLKKIEEKMAALERKLDAVLNLLLQDLYEEEGDESPFLEMEGVSNDLDKLT